HGNNNSNARQNGKNLSFKENLTHHSAHAFINKIHTTAHHKKYRSAHATLRRLDKKRQSLLDSFIGELNPISYSAANTAAKSSGNFDLINERILYRKAIEEKSDAEIIALVIKQRTEAALAFQRSVEMSLEQLSSIASDFESSNKSRRKMSF
ncbi:DUF4756 family protein, partial [Klebsiella pneumoniae]|uniref:DUF4756 family protein n=1 Tax=Klebsiella pneumoniae TaxID=573 RepID=UPI003746399F